MAGVRQFDEDKLIAGALDVFWEKGLPGTSMIDLAEATGVQRGSLYNAYGDKEALFLLAFDRYAYRFLEAARMALDDPDPRRALRCFFKVAIANMTSGSPSRGCLTTKTAIEAVRASPRVQKRLRLLLNELEASVAGALSHAPARQSLALAPRRAARIVVTFSRGLAVMERVYHQPAELTDAAEALVDALVPKTNSPTRSRASRKR